MKIGKLSAIFYFLSKNHSVIFVFILVFQVFANQTRFRDNIHFIASKDIRDVFKNIWNRFQTAPMFFVPPTPNEILDFLHDYIFTWFTYLILLPRNCVADCPCWWNVWGFDSAFHFYFGSWDHVGGICICILLSEWHVSLVKSAHIYLRIYCNSLQVPF